MQPGDVNGPPEQVVNCRCVTVGVLAGFDEAWKGTVYPEYAKENNGLYREAINQGVFSILPERMSKKHIREIAKEMKINLDGVTLVIDADPAKLDPAFNITGMTDSKKLGIYTSSQNHSSARKN